MPDRAFEVPAGAPQSWLVGQAPREEGRNRGRQRAAGSVGVPARPSGPADPEFPLGGAGGGRRRAAGSVGVPARQSGPANLEFPLGGAGDVYRLSSLGMTAFDEYDAGP